MNKFLSQVFSNGMCSSGEICSLVKESASRKFDIKDEVHIHQPFRNKFLNVLSYLKEMHVLRIFVWQIVKSVLDHSDAKSFLIKLCNLKPINTKKYLMMDPFMSPYWAYVCIILSC